MKNSILNTVIILCLLITQNVISQQNDSLRYEIMLNNEMLDESFKTEHFINNIDISSDNYITISSGNKVYFLGWGGISPLGNSIDIAINAFSYTIDGLLMAIKNDELCFMNENGSLEKMIQLPTSKMGIASGKEVMYLFDQNNNEHQYKLYAYSKGGKYKQLLQSPKSINAVVEMKDSIYIAIESAVFSFSSLDEQLNLVVGFKKDNKIKSMTVDTVNNILYLSTNEGIYAIRENSLQYITSDFKENIIKYFKNGLVVFNPDTKNIMRIVNIEKSIKF